MKVLLYLTLLLIGFPAQLVHPQVNDNINCATTPFFYSAALLHFLCGSL